MRVETDKTINTQNFFKFNKSYVAGIVIDALRE